MTDHVQQINEAIEKGHEPFDIFNLTASAIHRCTREMWLDFRNCSVKEFKTNRIIAMKIGQSIEAMVYQWLEDAGYKVSHKQSKLLNKYGNTIAKIDGIIFADKRYRLLSIKSCNSKHYKDWMKSANIDYEKKQAHIEMFHSAQLSQRGAILDSVFFVVVNKDTSEIHVEIMDYDKQYAEVAVNSIYEAIESESLPALDESFDCAWCNQKSVCKGETVAQINCRTCAHVSVVNGSFECVHGYGKICHRYVFHPQLVEVLGYSFEGIDHELEALLFDKMAIAGEGVKVPGKPTFTSEEFAIAHPAGLVHDMFIFGLKELCDADILEVK